MHQIFLMHLNMPPICSEGPQGRKVGFRGPGPENRVYGLLTEFINFTLNSLWLLLRVSENNTTNAQTQSGLFHPKWVSIFHPPLYAKFRAQPRNLIFRPRVPQPYFPAPGPFETRRRCLNASGVCFASNLPVEIVKIIIKPITSKYLNFQYVGRFFCQPCGENPFSKNVQKHKINAKIVIT